MLVTFLGNVSFPQETVQNIKPRLILKYLPLTLSSSGQSILLDLSNDSAPTWTAKIAATYFQQKCRVAEKREIVLVNNNWRGKNRKKFVFAVG